MDVVRDGAPDEFVLRHGAIKAYFANLWALRAQPRLYYGPWRGDPEEIGWNKDTHSLLLFGPPGVGKTEFAKSILQLFGEYLHITEKNGLKDFDMNIHKGILFDDMDFKEETDAFQKAITDPNNKADIRILYQSVSIPAGVARIFTANTAAIFKDEYGAIYDRRVKVYQYPRAGS